MVVRGLHEVTKISKKQRWVIFRYLAREWWVLFSGPQTAKEDVGAKEDCPQA